MPLQKLSDLSSSRDLFVNLTRRGLRVAFRDVMYDMRMPPLDELGYLPLMSVLSPIAGLAVFSRLEGKLAEAL